MKAAIRLIMLLAVLGALAISNPGEDKFQDYIQERVEQEIREDGSADSALGRFFTDLGSSIVGSLAARVSERTNYVIFSIYSVDVGGDGDAEERWRFLGIGGQFIELEKPE